MSTTLLENTDVRTLEAWLASAEAETAAEMDILAEAMKTNMLYGGASW
jgi:hypothetical protein